MCGLSLYCYSDNKFQDYLKSSLTSMKHRGPDDTNQVHKKVANYFVGLGHNRLSILDLSKAGAQPMSSKFGTTITYNGEVYNHVDLRKILQSKKYKFKGHSDTEAILYLYDEFGVSCFSMLHGMFAFVLLDEPKKKIYIVRDSLGIKPLYLYLNEKGLLASSEIKGLKSYPNINLELDRNDIFEFFNTGFLYEPDTGYKYIKKLRPGHYLEFDLISGNYQTFPFNVLLSESKALSLDKKIEKAVKEQLVSDVKIGVFFSGGIDSTLLANYSDGEDLLFAKYDSDPLTDLDLKFSHKIATLLKKELHIKESMPESDDVDKLIESIDFVARHSEEMISDYTFWPTYKLSKAAKESGYKVMLSGMGGDEIFSGYPRYLIVRHHRLIKLAFPLLKILYDFKIFPKRLNKRFQRLVSYSYEESWPIAYSRLLGYFSRKELLDFFPDFNHLNTQYAEKLTRLLADYSGQKRNKVKLAQYFDLKGFLSHNLMVSDKASMLASIELRVPLLDETIVAHGKSLPTRQQLRGFSLKKPLKKILLKILPKNLVKRPKTGFNPPLDQLINKIGKERIKQEVELLKDFINVSALESIIEEHWAGLQNHTYKLWQLIYFSRWIKIHMNS